MIIHQMLHGYKRGHQLLAADVQLDSESLDLVARLSDLSGSVAIDSSIQPYFTSYPLPNKKYYALARTWPDNTAPRAGCVLTQTLLIPMEHWVDCPYPIMFCDLFIKPKNSDDTARYAKKLDVTVSSSFPLVEVDKELLNEFVSRYFGEGITPIVWFNDNNSDNYFWILMHSFWPKLRRRFACCTYSLQPRSLENKFFDLMFAPSFSYSRFQKIPRQNFIEKHTFSTNSIDRGSTEEPWVRQWTNQIVSFRHNDTEEESKSETSYLLPYLSDDPTDIKKIYLVIELRKRSVDSPMASVGLLDIVESLAPAEFAAIDYKENAISVALDSLAKVNDLNEAVKCLLLISDRLSRKAYSQIDASVKASFTNTVSKYVVIEPATALKFAERLLLYSNDIRTSPYIIGLVNGLQAIGNDCPNELSVLCEFPDPATIIICIEPYIGVLYLRSGNPDDEKGARISQLSSWVSKITDDKDFYRVRQVLLPEVKNDQYLSLAEELLQQITNQDIPWILNTLIQSTQGFRDNGIRSILQDRVSKKYPEETRNWSKYSNIWSTEAAHLVSSTFQEGKIGIVEIINSEQFDPIKKSEILSAFILESSHNHNFPQWFQEYVKNDYKFLRTLLPLQNRIPNLTIKANSKIIDEVWELPWVNSFTAREIDFIITNNQTTFAGELIPSVMRSATINFIVGKVDWLSYQQFEATTWGEQWLIEASSRDIQLVLSKMSQASQDSWSNAWKWVAGVGDKFYQYNGVLITKLIATLLHNQKWSWKTEITSCWVSILQKLHDQSTSSVYLQACSSALSYSFHNYRFPLSEIVVEAFLPVYKAVLESKELPPETYDLFAYYEWDKGKELRKKLVNTFIRSDWPPGNLTLSAKDKTLFRKIYSRTHRVWRGDDYIKAMLTDLRGRISDDNAKMMENELNNILNDKHFYESWD